MKSQAIKVAIAATLVSAASIGIAPASDQHEPYILALATGHQRTANDARGKQSYDYDREPLHTQKRGNQWDPWGHWGNYYGPMVY
jgi:hypothetical protein